MLSNGKTPNSEFQQNFHGFTKENINTYLDALSKQIKKEFGRNVMVEIIIVGDGSILLSMENSFICKHLLTILHHRLCTSLLSFREMP